MKQFFLLLILLVSQIVSSQKINVLDCGAKGNGVTDDTEAFMKALKELDQKYGSKKIASFLYVPNGSYLISKSIILDKYISIEGEFVNTTKIRMKTSNTPLIILKPNLLETEIYNSYTYVRNLTLLGTDYLNNDQYFKPRLISKFESENTGIKVLGLRTRIENVQVEGFLNNGIDVARSYYTFITRSFLKNNAVGLSIRDISTSVFLTESELRFNSIGILIKEHSFGNFISNNMIESNVGRFYGIDKSINQTNTTNSMGRAIVISTGYSNTISQNFFENHFVNITLENSYRNVVTNNFITLSEYTETPEKNQVSLQLVGKSTENIFENNNFLFTRPDIVSNRILIGDGDYSSNRIDVGVDNLKIKSLLKKTIKEDYKLPQIKN